VINPTSGELYGHVVAGDPGGSVAFIIPAYQVFHDIERRLGSKVTINSQEIKSVFRPGMGDVGERERIPRKRRIPSIDSQLRQTDIHPQAISPDKTLYNNRGPQPPMPSQRRRRERIPEERRYPLLCFTNTWDPAFFNRRDLTGKDDVSAVEAKKSIGEVGDELTVFLQVSEDLGCPCEADEVKRYCEGVSLEDLEAGVGEAGERRAAWLDDRNSLDQTGRGYARLYDNPLTATGLLKYLKQSVGTRPELPLRLTSPTLLTSYQRHNNGDQLKAERRLMWGFLTSRFMCSTTDIV